jgi:hypothetical protein
LSRGFLGTKTAHWITRQNCGLVRNLTGLPFSFIGLRVALTSLIPLVAKKVRSAAARPLIRVSAIKQEPAACDERSVFSADITAVFASS